MEVPVPPDESSPLRATQRQVCVRIEKQEEVCVRIEKQEEKLDAAASTKLWWESLGRVWPAFSIGFTGGFLVAVLDPFQYQITIDFQWCSGEVSCDDGSLYFALVSLALFLGAILGCLLCRFVAEVGRVFILRAICIFVIPGSLIVGLTPDGSNFGSSNLWGMLIAGRAISGIGMGWICVSSPLYVSEMTAVVHRGKFQMCSMVAQSAGSFAALALALAVTDPPGSPGWANTAFDQWYWRAIVLVPVLLCGLSLLALCRASETPYILCKHGRQEEARALLQRIHGRDDVHEEFDRANGQAQRALSKTIISPEQRLVRGEKRGEYWHALLVGAVLGALQNLSGARAVFASSTGIVMDAGLRPYDAVLVSTFLLLLNVLANYASTHVIDRWGRKPMLLISFGGQTAGALVGAMAFWLNPDDPDRAMSAAIVSLYLFILAYGLGVSSIPCAYLSEIFPRDFSAFGMGVGAACNWAGVAAMTFITVYYSNLVVFTTFFCVSLVAVVFVALCIRETKSTSIFGSPFFSDAVQTGSS